MMTSCRKGDGHTRWELHGFPIDSCQRHATRVARLLVSTHLPTTLEKSQSKTARLGPVTWNGASIPYIPEVFSCHPHSNRQRKLKPSYIESRIRCICARERTHRLSTTPNLYFHIELCKTENQLASSVTLFCVNWQDILFKFESGRLGFLGTSWLVHRKQNFWTGMTLMWQAYLHVNISWSWHSGVCSDEMTECKQTLRSMIG